MKHLLAIAFITLLALGTGCAWISPSSQTTSDGIQVHGHWTVTVTNPDGSVDAVHEFDNAFEGHDTLLYILSGLEVLNRTYNPGGKFDGPPNWFIRLQGDSLDSSNIGCDKDDYVHVPLTDLNLYAIIEPKWAENKLNIAAVCTIIKAYNSPKIEQVSTQIYTHAADGTGAFTMRDLTKHDFEVGKEIEVETGQILSFNISISFD